MSMQLQLRTLPSYPVAKPSVGLHVSKDVGSTKTDEPTYVIYFSIQIQISHAVVFLRGVHFTSFHN